MSGSSLDSISQFDEEAHSHANALVFLVAKWMIEEHPNPEMRKHYSRGVDAKGEDIQKEWRNWLAVTERNDSLPERIDNKLRANFHGEKDGDKKVKEWTKRMGKHKVLRYVNGKLKLRLHYFPVCLDEEGLISHRGCQNCKLP